MTPPQLPNRVLIFGSGSIAVRHAQLWRELQPQSRIGRVNAAGRPPSQPEFDELVDDQLDSLDAALGWGAGAAIVANAASNHPEAVRSVVESGLPVLVEKPLAVSPDGVATLEDLAPQGGAPVLVGYCLRHHPLVRRLVEVAGELLAGQVLGVRAVVGQHLDDWRPGRAGTSTVTAWRGLGGGAVFELSHELDLCLAVAGSAQEVSALTVVSPAAAGDAEDVAAVGIRHSGGALSSVSLNLLERPARRTLTVIGDDATINLDMVGGRLTTAVDGHEPQVATLPHGYTATDMYRAQLIHFAKCIAGEAMPEVDVTQGIAVARLCLAIHESAASKRAVFLQ